MILNSKRLSKAVVQTMSGVRVGRLVSIDLDGDTGKLAAIHVAPHGAVAGLLAQELVIEWSCIVSMNEEEIVVRDAFAMDAAKRDARKYVPSAQPVGSHLKET